MASQPSVIRYPLDSTRIASGSAALGAGILLFWASVASWYQYRGGGPFIGPTTFQSVPEGVWRTLLISGGEAGFFAMALAMWGRMLMVGAAFAVVGVGAASAATFEMFREQISWAATGSQAAVSTLPGEALAPIGVLLLVAAVSGLAVSARRPVIPTTAR